MGFRGRGTVKILYNPMKPSFSYVLTPWDLRRASNSYKYTHNFEWVGHFLGTSFCASKLFWNSGSILIMIYYCHVNKWFVAWYFVCMSSWLGGGSSLASKLKTLSSDNFVQLLRTLFRIVWVMYILLLPLFDSLSLIIYLIFVSGIMFVN